VFPIASEKYSAKRINDKIEEEGGECNANDYKNICPEK
jgi:hypothetical protein